MADDVFELKVPLVHERPPLSANHRVHWRKKAELVAMVRDSVAWRAKQAHIGRQDHIVVALHFAPQDKRRRDASNLMPTQKAAVDGLVLAGVVEDDTARWVTELMPVLHEPDGGARRMWLQVLTAGGVSAVDRAGIAVDVAHERAADAADRDEGEQ
jgi:crossover junction endodeoxyribonuclease RusA